MKLTDRLNTLANLFRLISQKRASFIVFTIVIVVTSLFEMVGVGTLYPMLELLGNQERKYFYLEKINAFLNIEFPPDLFLVTLFSTFAVVFVLRGLFIIASIRLQFRLVETLKIKFQSKIFDNFLREDYDFFVRQKIGDLTQKQLMHTENAGQAVLHSCQFIRNVLVFIFLYAMMWSISASISLAITLGMIVMGVFTVLFSKLRIYVLAMEQAQLQKQIYSMSVEVFMGIRQVKAFVVENYFKNKFNNAIARNSKILISNNSIPQFPGPVLQTIILLGVIVAVLYAMSLPAGEQDLIPLFGIFIGATYRIATALAAINSDIMKLGHFMPSVNIVAGLIDSDVPEENKPTPRAFNNNIKFNDVSFRYPGKANVLEHVNLSIDKGKYYGIVGASGSGKSTLIDLMIGFYSPQEGSISVDGKNFREIDLASWRKQIGLVSQDVFIFSGTLEENIAFSIAMENQDKERLVKAAKAADIHDFILSLPDGYQTEVGERGLQLSGGQRQRLAIARSVYHSPSIYIFDEATSALDRHSEKRIQEAIEKLSKNSTVVVIAHRLSTIENADEIIVLDNGKIVETGSYDDLVSNQGMFAGLYSL